VSGAQASILSHRQLCAVAEITLRRLEQLVSVSLLSSSLWLACLSRRSSSRSKARNVCQMPPESRRMASVSRRRVATFSREESGLRAARH
jgi:hypothetical protein